MRTHLLAAVLASLLAAPAAAAPWLPGLDAGALGPWRGTHVPGEVLVKFRPAATAASRTAAVRARGHALLGEVADTPWMHVKTAPGESVEAALAAYAANPDVEWAQPNYVYRIAAVPNDPGYGLLWAMNNTGQDVSAAPTQPAGGGLDYPTGNPGTAGDDMSLEAAWNVITNCSNVVVAVADTGVNYTHVDLEANMWNGGAGAPNHGKNFVATTAGDDATMDLHGHGTHVAGTIGAVGNNGTGVAGVCWSATIMAIRVLNEQGAGTSASIVAGVDWAATHGAKVINMSLGGGGAFDQAYSDAITTALDHDVLVVVAAGNENTNNDGGTASWPCNFTHANLLCVAALDQGYALASFSNWGSTSVDVGAPGTNIVSTWPGEVLSVPMTTGWMSNGPGWGYATVPMAGGGSAPAVAAPSTFPSGTYDNNADWRAYIGGTIPADTTRALLKVRGAVSLADTGDYFRIAWVAGSNDPFAGGGDGVQLNSDANTGGKIVELDLDMTSCGTGTCTIGVQLQSNAQGQGQGVAIFEMSIALVENGSSAYNTENGTSMATPNTAGVAALLRAYNPSFTAADTRTAIEQGGTAVAALAGKTTTGRAVDAMGSLRYVRPPRSVAATGAVVTTP